MKKYFPFALALMASLTATTPTLAADDEAGFKSLMDGKTFDGWKVTTDSPAPGPSRMARSSRTARWRTFIMSGMTSPLRISISRWKS